MEIGIHSFAAMLPDPSTGRVPTSAERLAALIDEMVLADRVGIGSFGVGEHHRPEYADASQPSSWPPPPPAPMPSG